MIRTVFAMAVAASAACSYKGKFADCEIVCTQSTGCPPGFSCSASEAVCRSGETARPCAEIFDADVDADVDAAVDGGSSSCPVSFGGGRYLFVNMLVTWPAAEAYCTALDATPGDALYVHLVVINSAGELGLLTPTGTPMDDAWLGYTDSKLNPSGLPDAAQFRWVTDEPGVAMWASGQPDDSSGPRCAYKNFGNGLMHDRTCTHTRTFFCECDAFPENPNNL